ncbi:MAG TPA: EscU/YscU/HrcU family type III secretion system export apparatus switch protein [Planctomycetota bacterium]|nr:EscU/YscU/HrcU family type III secretion system export apparatus switch protein [Planctomycetota bacterium]
MTTNGSSPEKRERAGIERAVALRHDRDSGGAPRVVARGRGEVARRLVEIAAEHGVPVREDPDLAALLALVDLGDDIAVELYQAVAEVICFCTERGAPPGDRS